MLKINTYFVARDRVNSGYINISIPNLESRSNLGPTFSRKRWEVMIKKLEIGITRVACRRNGEKFIDDNPAE